MDELITAAFSLINLPFTLLLIVVLLYWTSVILGALDVDAFDFDMDGDVDVDMDVDVDADVDADGALDAADAGQGWMMAVLRFFNFGEVPVMIIISIFVFCMWAFHIQANHHLGNKESLLFSLVLVVPNVMASLFVAKIVSQPFLGFFKQLRADESSASKPMVGRPCEVISLEVSTEMGQVEIKTDGAPIRLNAITLPGDKPVKKGEQAVVIEERSEDGLYVIKALDIDL